MIRPLFAATLALAALAAPTVAGAKTPRAPAASWHPAMGPEGRYCVRASHLETAAMTGTRIYQRACRSERDWAERGVTFARRQRGGPALAAH